MSLRYQFNFTFLSNDSLILMFSLVKDLWSLPSYALLDTICKKDFEDEILQQLFCNEINSIKAL